MPNRDISYLKEKVRKLTDSPGVYLMKDRLGAILYVGKARNLKRRVSTYFQASRRHKMQQPKVAAMLELIHDFDFIEVKSEAEALLLESRLIKHWKPKYNTELTDDKRYPLVRVDIESPLPRFRVTRLKTSDKSRYFGPFVFAAQMRETLLSMRKQFGILLSDAKPTRLEDGKWMLYDDIRSEIFGDNANVVTEAAYRERVDMAMSFLEGRSREWLDLIRKQMKEAAEKREYEKAAQLRDLAIAMENTLSPTRKFTVLPSRAPDELVLEELAGHLKLKAPPQNMECFDISHISGSFCVASMVHFTGGKPDKANYRRFRIKSFIGNDDFRAMEEVVGRRYRRLHDEGKPFPDLLVIDGGLGQIASSLRAFITQGLEPPFMIGLAKQHERVFFADGRPPLDLPIDSESRKLLQRIRDEAHRFANTYNADLRSKRIKESILDDFPGIGPVKRNALLLHFKSIERMKKASMSDLAAVEGIGDNMAQSLYQFLHVEK